MFKLKFIIPLIFIFFQSVANAKDSLKTDSATQLIQKFVLDSGAPGLAISVGYKDKIIWSRGFGYADLEQQVPVDPAVTKFRVGSIAKPFTAFALAKLLETEKIELDTEIHRYVPSFPNKKYPITVRQLAGHLSGIRHYAGEEIYSRIKYSSVIDGLEIFQNDPLLHKPGAEWTYTSYGYNLLSAVIEQAAGENFLEYMTKHVFLPLGMQHTVADHLGEIIPNRSRYYLRRDNTFFNEPEVDNSYKWASGGYLSTTEDLVRFGMAHLNNKNLTQSTIEQLWTIQKTTTGEATGYGLGWRIVIDEENQKWIGHGGGSIGGTTQFWIFPENGLVFAVVSNMSSLSFGMIIPQLQKLFSHQIALEYKLSESARDG